MKKQQQTQDSYTGPSYKIDWHRKSVSIKINHIIFLIRLLIQPQVIVLKAKHVDICQKQSNIGFSPRRRILLLS